MTTYAPVSLSRPCPVPACPDDAANGHCMCKRHWAFVPPETQDLELAAFRAWCRDAITDDAYREALWIAIRSAQRTERNGTEPSQRRRRPRPGEPRVYRVLPDVPRPRRG